eukprot:2974484-Heterocapsa_arctica.AAC.1
MDDRDPRLQGDRTYHPSYSCADRAQGDSGEETSGVRKEELLLAAHVPVEGARGEVAFHAM